MIPIRMFWKQAPSNLPCRSGIFKTCTSALVFMHNERGTTFLFLNGTRSFLLGLRDLRPPGLRHILLRGLIDELSLTVGSTRNRGVISDRKNVAHCLNG
jgi:hypothetical protein